MRLGSGADHQESFLRLDVSDLAPQPIVRQGDVESIAHLDLRQPVPAHDVLNLINPNHRVVRGEHLDAATGEKEYRKQPKHPIHYRGGVVLTVTEVAPEVRAPIWIRVFTQKKMGALALLGFASGLPLLLTGDTLQAWMKVEGVDLKTIGLFSLVGLPYSLKFLWSPFVDRIVPPFFGRRRGWLLATQLFLAVAIGAMAFQDPKTALQALAINALLLAAFSATQDIAFDAYRTDVLSHREMGAGAAIAVLGYRIALLVAGSAALIAADHLSWPAIYVGMGVLMLLGVAATAFAPEPALKDKPPASLREAVTDPFVEFYRRSRGRAAAILAFIVLYKLGDFLAASMATPFLLDLRFSMTDLGAIKGGVGLIATIAGTLAGGAILSKIGINRSLWVFGFLQMASNLAYIVLSVSPTYGFMVSATIVENVCAGLGTAAFVAFLMSLCSVRFSATQYALLSSLMAASRSLLVAPAGGWAEQTGWPLFFLITLLAALPGLALLPVFAPWGRRSPFGAAEREDDVIEAARRET